MKRALITGIAGQDGYYLARYLYEERGYEVFGLGRSAHPDSECIKRDLPFVRVFSGDLVDAASVQRVCEAIAPDEIYNLGAISSVEISFSQPDITLDINGGGIQRVLSAACDLTSGDGAVRVYQASSSEMFGGGRGDTALDERSDFRPRSPYAIAKVAGHHFVHYYRSAFGVFACSGICFNHESPRRPSHFVTRKVTQTVARIKYGLVDELVLGNLEAKRDWGFAGDYVRAMWAMLQAPHPEDYVICTGRTHSVRELVSTAFAAAGIEGWEKYVRSDDPRYTRPLEVDELCGDSSKAERVLGWKPEVTFEELVEMMVEEDLRRVAEREL